MWNINLICNRIALCVACVSRTAHICCTYAANTLHIRFTNVNMYVSYAFGAQITYVSFALYVLHARPLRILVYVPPRSRSSGSYRGKIEAPEMQVRLGPAAQPLAGSLWENDTWLPVRVGTVGLGTGENDDKQHTGNLKVYDLGEAWQCCFFFPWSPLISSDYKPTRSFYRGFSHVCQPGVSWC